MMKAGTPYKRSPSNKTRFGSWANSRRASSHSDSPCRPMPAARGLCSPSSKRTLTVILANAARPRRDFAFVVVAVICGVLVTLYCVPSSAVRRQPRQNASR